MYEVELDGEIYSVMHQEDFNFESGCITWDVYDDFGAPVDDETETKVISFLLENMDSLER